MQIIRRWTPDPNSIPLFDLNIDLAQQVIYHVGPDRKLTGATLKMSSGDDVEVDGPLAESILLMIGGNDFSSKEFLGKAKEPTQAEAHNPRLTWALIIIFLLVCFCLVWK